MENQESKSKWDDLARELGAEIRPDEPATPPASSDAAQESYSQRQSADKPRTAPPKRAANWSQLNVELGLPPVEEPPPPDLALPTPPIQERLSPPPAARSERPREDRPREERPRHDRPREDRPRRDREHGDRDDGGREGGRGRGHDRGRRDEHDQSRSDRGEAEPTEGERGSGGRGRRGRRGRGGRGQRDRDSQQDRAEREQTDRPHGERGQRDRPDRSQRDRQREERPQEKREPQPTFFEVGEIDERVVEIEQSIVDEDRPTPEPTAPPTAEAPQTPSAGVSLWHKIFGSPAQQTAKLTEQASEAEHVEIAESIAESIPERESSWSPMEDELRATPPSAAELAAAEIETGIETDDESVGADEGEPRGRPRRRRRGRGGRVGRGSEGEQSGRRDHRASQRSDTNRGHDDDFDDLGVEQDDVDAGRADGNGTDFDVDDDLGDAGDGESTERSADSRGHRSIPSWDEAIGMIVDSNLQSRSERPRSSHSGRRGGSSRGGSSRGGRSRGGRRHSNPQNGQ